MSSTLPFSFGDVTVVESDALPLSPSPGTDARRLVRHGLAHVLGWLGEEVGPAPGEPTHMIIVGRTMLASAIVANKLRDGAGQ